MLVHCTNISDLNEINAKYLNFLRPYGPMQLFCPWRFSHENLPRKLESRLAPTSFLHDSPVWKCAVMTLCDLDGKVGCIHLIRLDNVWFLLFSQVNSIFHTIRHYPTSTDLKLKATNKPVLPMTPWFPLPWVPSGSAPCSLALTYPPTRLLCALTVLLYLTRWAHKPQC